MCNALNNYVIRGVTHNVPLCHEVLTNPKFIAGKSYLKLKFIARKSNAICSIC